MANRARPIDDVLKDAKTPTRLRRLLSEIPSIKAFGEKNGLKPTKNYQDYVQLDRPAAVWVVSACEPLHFKSKEWGFPVVGSFPYLGWFDLKDAKEYAADLRKENWDVDVRGAGAYSTLGWFRDSVVSSMIPDGEEALGELVNVVLHESVHATLYISGQAYFNESIANFIADRLTPPYLWQKVGKEAPESKAYVEADEASEQRGEVLHRTYEALSSLYASSKPDSEKLEEKAKILAKVKEDLKYKRDINNATLVQFKTYHTGIPELEALYRACGGDAGRLLLALKTVNSKSFKESQQEDLGPVILPLARAGCRAEKS